MWSYRHLIPVLLLIAAVECILATEHVLEESFKGEIMHCSPLTAASIQWYVLAGAVAGCLFAWWWMHRKRYSYLKLLIVGTGTLACHMISYYFLISHDINISVLYIPAVLRGFSYAILSATFMVCLEEIMSFRHFFQALSVFNMLHMVIGGVVGSALYSRGLAYFITDNAARYGAALDSVAVSADPAGYASAAGQFAAGMEKRQGRHSLDIRKTHPFHALIIKFFRKKILFYLILYLNLRRKIPERGLHVTIY